MRLVSKILVTLEIFAGVVSSMTLTSCGPQEEAHTHTFAEERTSDDTHHWHEATCEHSGERDSYAEHTWDSGKVTTPEGCETDGVMTYTCTTCEDTKTETINATGHSWDDGEITTPATCLEPGVKTYTCTVCETTRTEPIDATGHSYSEEWTTNETYHWHEATCEHSDEISGKAEHSYNADGVCVCGYRAISEETLPTTLNELMQEGNEKYQAVVVKTLNDHLLEDMLYNTLSNNYDVNCVQIDQWEVVDSDKNGIIDCIKLHFFYDNAIISTLYRISCVEPKTEITLQDLLTENPDAAKLDEAFDRGTLYVNAKYSIEYAFGYDPTIQEMRKVLLDAVNEKLAAEGLISAVDENTRSFIIRDYESTEDTTLGKTKRIVVMNLTENSYEEITILIKEAEKNNDDTKLIENLNAGQYKVLNDVKRGKFTGTLLKGDISETGGKATTD